MNENLPLIDDIEFLIMSTGEEQLHKLSNGETGFLQTMSFMDGYRECMFNNMSLKNFYDKDIVKIIDNSIQQVKNQLVTKEKELRENDPEYKDMEKQIDRSGESIIDFLESSLIDQETAVDFLNNTRISLFGEYMWNHLQQPYTPKFLNDTYNKYLKLIN